MLRPLTTRLALMYLGATVVVLALLLIASEFSEIARFRDGVNESLPPAVAQVVDMMTAQQKAGRSLKDAGEFAAAHLGRPNLFIVVNDNLPRTVFSDAHDWDWLEFAARTNSTFLGMHFGKGFVPGGVFYLNANPSHLVKLVGSRFTRMALPMLLLILVAYGLSSVLAARATRPLRDVTRAMRALAGSDFRTRPIGPPGTAETLALTEAFNAAAGAVQEAAAERERGVENMRTFISDASHELKTPLTIIMGYIDAVSEGLVIDPVDSRRILKKTLNECRRMRDTVEKLIVLDGLDRPSDPTGAIDVGALARDVGESMRAITSNLRVHVAVDDSERLCAGDEHELREALVNVIENAVKYAPGSPIDLRVAAVAGVIVVEIVDAGPGMSAEDRARAFDRFYRGSSRGTAEGSGLGLAIAKAAAQRANGRISLTSELGRGTTVKFYLPSVSADSRRA